MSPEPPKKPVPNAEQKIRLPRGKTTLEIQQPKEPKRELSSPPLQQLKPGAGEKPSKPEIPSQSPRLRPRRPSVRSIAAKRFETTYESAPFAKLLRRPLYEPGKGRAALNVVRQSIYRSPKSKDIYEELRPLSPTNRERPTSISKLKTGANFLKYSKGSTPAPRSHIFAPNYQTLLKTSRDTSYSGLQSTKEEQSVAPTLPDTPVPARPTAIKGLSATALTEMELAGKSPLLNAYMAENFRRKGRSGKKITRKKTCSLL